jgi:hypothetical protein
MLNSESKIYHPKSKICPTRYQQPATAATPPIHLPANPVLLSKIHPKSKIQNPKLIIRLNITRQQTFRFLRGQTLAILLSTDEITT